MKNTLLLILWLVISFLLVCSIIGLLLFLPGVNDSFTYIPISERRSTWCTIGLELLELIKKE